MGTNWDLSELAGKIVLKGRCRHKHPSHERGGDGGSRIVDVNHDDSSGLRGAKLEKNSGAGRLLFLDAQSGVAGDMVVAALVDLGVPFAVVTDAVSRLKMQDVELELTKVPAGPILASRFAVQIHGAQSERSYGMIDDLIAQSSLSDSIKGLARSIFLRLAKAEAEVHGVPISEVHFHEVGAADAIADIVGAAAAFDWIGATVVASPLPMGFGQIECRHGRLPLPAPATVLCLRGVPTYDARIEGELVTPTGAAIVATVARRFERWPRFSPERVGWGKGTRELPDRVNALRGILGIPASSELERRGDYLIVEASLDDISGELAGHLISSLIKAGALDAWATSTVMKKGRPGLVVSALAPRASETQVTQALLRESTSIGLRYHFVDRIERPRRQITVQTSYGGVQVKVSGGDFGPPQLKPEFERCAELAERAGVPVREVIRAAMSAISEDDLKAVLSAD